MQPFKSNPTISEGSCPLETMCTILAGHARVAAIASRSSTVARHHAWIHARIHPRHTTRHTTRHTRVHPWHTLHVSIRIAKALPHATIHFTFATAFPLAALTFATPFSIAFPIAFLASAADDGLSTGASHVDCLPLTFGFVVLFVELERDFLCSRKEQN